jgi:hypothetical protein
VFRERHCRLARFLVGGVLAAMATVLLVFNPARLFLLVLRGRIVAAFAVGAFEGYDVSHGDLSHSISMAHRFELAIGIEPMTSSLPRKCSTN